MATVTFPLSAAEFIGLAHQQTTSYMVSAASQVLESGGGEIVTATYGPSLWTGSVSSHLLTRDCSRKLKARLNLLEVNGGSFMWVDPKYSGPAYDKGGAIIAGFTPSLIASKAVTLGIFCT